MHTGIVLSICFVIGSIVFARTQDDADVFLSIFLVIIGWIFLLDADYDEVGNLPEINDVIIVSSRPPTLGIEGQFFITSGIINSRVTYILRKKVDGGYQDFLTGPDTVLKYDVELSGTGVYRTTYRCTQRQLYTEIFFIVRWNHNIENKCELHPTIELFVPKGYISLGIQPI